MKFLSVVGARPQFIKLSPFCRAIEAYNISPREEAIESVIVHTGQHYDYELSEVLFNQMQIPTPNYNLEVGSTSHGQQTAWILQRVEEVLLTEKPDIVIVFGDTNSTLAGALAAAKLQIPVVHSEAGLRSFNKKMPEEINRVITDHVSTILFCPTDRAVANLRREGFQNVVHDWAPSNDMYTVLKEVTASNSLVVKTGDIMYDAFVFNEQRAEQSSTILRDLSLTPGMYALLTIHRAENTEDSVSLKKVLDFLRGEGLEYPLIFPVHPRTKNLMRESNLRLPESIKMIPPVSYFDMLILEKNASRIYTDSGGVQKEAFFVKVPCITLRNQTEWTETIEGGWNKLMTDPERAVGRPRAPDPTDTGPYGDGRAARTQIEVLTGYYLSRSSKGHLE